MTTKKFSQSKMGRNPFAAAKALNAASVVASASSARNAGTAKSRAPIPGAPESLLFAAIALPIRTVIMGIKSLLIARYVFAHPEEWRL